MDTPSHRAYPYDISDEDWAFLAPSHPLMRDDAPQRRYPLRELFNGLGFIALTGLQWSFMPHEFQPWHAVCEQTRRRLAADVFTAIIADLRELIRLASDRPARPTAAILDSRTLTSTPKSGHRAGWDGYKRRKGSKVRLAVDTLGHLLALRVTPANAGDRSQVGELTAAVQEATGASVEVGYVDAEYVGVGPRAAAAANGIDLLVVKLPGAKRGFMLLPRRWVVERDFAWASRFRRLARDQERLADVLAGFHLTAFVLLMLRQAEPAMALP